MMLADLGADVVKIERPEGDPFRAWDGGKYGPPFVGFNRNKRSVKLDLTKADDRATLNRLLAVADVMIDNMRPDSLLKLGINSDRIKRLNPKLIHCSITGYGEIGPYRNKPDLVNHIVTTQLSNFLEPRHF